MIKIPSLYVLQTTGTDTSMNKLDHSLVDTCSILKEVTDDRADCLKKFIKCKPLVKWIKEAMPCKFMNKFQIFLLDNKIFIMVWSGVWCLMPLSTIF